MRRPGLLRTFMEVEVEVATDRGDAALLARVAADDQEAFACLYDRHVARVYSHCARQLGTVQDADDVTALVFLEAWRRRDSIRIVSGSALPWLLMTATNVARNHRRSMRRFRGALARIPAPPDAPDHADDVAAREAAEPGARALAAALASLSPIDRQVVLLCLIDGLTYAEVAEVLGLSHAAVRSRLMRARRAIRSALQDAGITGYGEEIGDA